MSGNVAFHTLTMDLIMISDKKEMLCLGFKLVSSNQQRGCTDSRKIRKTQCNGFVLQKAFQWNKLATKEAKAFTYDKR